jgi:hypothetical protein
MANAAFEMKDVASRERYDAGEFPQVGPRKLDAFDNLISAMVSYGLKLPKSVKTKWKTKTVLGDLRQTTANAYTYATERNKHFDRDEVAWNAAALLEAGGDLEKEGIEYWSAVRPNVAGFKNDSDAARLAFDMSQRELTSAVYGNADIIGQMDEIWKRVVLQGSISDEMTVKELREVEALAVSSIGPIGQFVLGLAMYQGALPGEIDAMRKSMKGDARPSEFPTIARYRAVKRAAEYEAVGKSAEEEAQRAEKKRAGDIAAGALGALARSGAGKSENYIPITVEAANAQASKEADVNRTSAKNKN